MTSEKSVPSLLLLRGGGVGARERECVRVPLDMHGHVGDCKTVAATGFDKEMPWT